ncbi:MAG: response regulator [Parcubacteria group bacterium]|nr:response regulator [Parcubacteria group bacterium]
MAKKILIVEDEISLIRILSARLKEEGFDVLEANNGKKGLEIALKEHPDLILLDIIMPLMDGMKMLEKLRKDSWGKEAKIIVLTNLSNGTVGEAVEKGVKDYLIKADWKLGEVIEKVKNRLK